MVLKINGDIVGNDWKEIYDWFGIECSTPGDVQKALAELPKGDRLQVKINSGGGEVMAGQEMYAAVCSVCTGGHRCDGFFSVCDHTGNQGTAVL